MTNFADFFVSDGAHAFRLAENPLTRLLGIAPSELEPSETELLYRACRHSEQHVIILTSLGPERPLYPVFVSDDRRHFPDKPIFGWAASDPNSEFDTFAWSEALGERLKSAYAQGFSEDLLRNSKLTKAARCADSLQRMLLLRYTTLDSLTRPVQIRSRFWKRASADEILRRSEALGLNWEWYEKLLAEEENALLNAEAVAGVDNEAVRFLARRLKAESKAINAFNDCIIELRHEMFD